MTAKVKATEVVAEQQQEQQKPQQWVRYRAHFEFQERTISERDWRSLGAEGDDVADVTWNQRNRWRVRRERIPLTDEQLEAYLAIDDGLELYEGN